MTDLPESPAPDRAQPDEGGRQSPADSAPITRRSGSFGRLPIVVTAALVVFAFAGAVALGAFIRRAIETPPPVAGSSPSAGIAEPSPTESGATASPLPTPSAATAASASPNLPSDDRIPIDSIARVVTNDLRVRSAPGVSSASKRLIPLLDAGREVFVVAGPVAASGYDWYQVEPVLRAGDDEGLPFGWVAAAGKDGEQWLAGGRFKCPSAPTHFEEFVVLQGTIQLACFGDDSLTFMARIGNANEICPLEAPWTIEPEWLTGEGCQRLLVYSVNSDDGFYPVLDPVLRPPDLPPGVEPNDAIMVEITGHHDHPSARTCKGVKNETGAEIPLSPEEIVLHCRSQFVVTSIRAVTGS
ncbi:MAG TPA: hypothetical protein VJZ72_10050 [Candidatus Limnocylindrales bacterium]|nr:hypothetical protein [Candidatus Limnocylindrales bacterium]